MSMRKYNTAVTLTHLDRDQDPTATPSTPT